ncbi:MAG: metal ABC transporter permease [Pirellulaceae bacterium]|nr:metal ABC transporter permease [Pirellulaceae bacterium]
MIQLSWEVDGWIMLAGALCSVAAALLGNFLVLRRMSLLGDAISHAVLPGLAAAFLISGQRQGWMIFVGAALVGVLTVFLTEAAREFGKVDEGAAIGVVFTFLFALGLVMIVQVADRVDLDPGCVLYGAIETTLIDQVRVGSWSIPRAVINLSIVTLLNFLFVVLLYRPLKVSTFDSQLAQSQGIPVRLLHYALACLVAITSVAAFESVGNILVVAMFVVPPVTAWLCTDRLGWMIGLSVVFAVLSAVLGHLSAIGLPALFGLASTSTSGMMAVAAGGLLCIAGLFAVRKGLISQAFHHWRSSQHILGEDLLGLLYRNHSQGASQIPERDLLSTLLVPNWRSQLALRRLERKGWIERLANQVALSDSGLAMAQNVVRAHRLWEHYLSAEAGLPENLLHGGAERLEHYTDRELRDRLNAETNAPTIDPHGKNIPPEA